MNFIDRMRRNGCQRKHRHDSMAEAEAHIKSLVIEGLDDGKRLNAYPCFFCKGWHVGHHEIPKTKAQRKAEKRRRQ